MIDAAMIDAMVEAGCSVEQLAAVVKAALLADARREDELRAAAAERQRQSRARRASGHAMSRDVTHVTVTTRDTCDPPASPPSPLVPPFPEPLSPLNPPHPPLHSPEDARPRGGNPAVVLGCVVNPMIARRFVDHCAGKGRRLSAEQAEVIAGELRRIEAGGGSAVAALETAIGMGWTTIRADGREAGGSPLAQARDGPMARKDLMGAIRRVDDRLEQQNGTISTSYVEHPTSGRHLPAAGGHG